MKLKEVLLDAKEFWMIRSSENSRVFSVVVIYIYVVIQFDIIHLVSFIWWNTDNNWMIIVDDNSENIVLQVDYLQASVVQDT